jgi:hypothetical protein
VYKPRKLTPEQARDLREHLAEVLAGRALEYALAAIDLAASYCHPPEVTARERAAHKRQVERQARGDLKMAEAIERLRALIVEGHLFEELGGEIDGLEPESFDRMLQTVADAARNRCEWYQGQVRARRGRPPDEDRDRLIATVYTVYPRDTPRDHFYRAVELVLGFVNRGREDLHGVIAASLSRNDPKLLAAFLKYAEQLAGFHH